MLTDLSVLAIVAAVVLAIVGLAMVWVGRAWSSGITPAGGKLTLRTRSMRDERAQAAGIRAAGRFLERYGRIITVLCVAVVGISFINDVTAIVVYTLALCFLALAAVVCLRQAERAARAAVGSHA